jgi:hypothetical protein
MCIVLDPSRIAAQVVSGIGFLGAGSILFKRRGRARFDDRCESLVGRGNRSGSRRRYVHRSHRRDDHYPRRGKIPPRRAQILVQGFAADSEFASDLGFAFT